MFVVCDKGIGKKKGTCHSSEHSISKDADCMTKDIQCWYAVITTPVAMNDYEAGSEGTSSFYVKTEGLIHVGS